jgi:hypothetical protein
MNFRTWACALIAACVTLGSVASADVSVVFTKDEIAVINDYYARYPMDAGAGQHKKNKGLPPGIAKQQLPQDLVRLLPPVRTGYERVVVDGRVLLVDIATQVIHDVLMEAVYH